MDKKEQNREDARWKQRFAHYCAALKTLSDAVELSQTRSLSDLEKRGLIKSFEYTHDMAWKTMKNFLEDQGNQDLFGSKGSTRMAFEEGLIQEGDVWMDMIQNRNLTAHTYNQNTAEKISDEIIHHYFPAILAFQSKMNEQINREGSR